MIIGKASFLMYSTCPMGYWHLAEPATWRSFEILLYLSVYKTESYKLHVYRGSSIIPSLLH